MCRDRRKPGATKARGLEREKKVKASLFTDPLFSLQSPSSAGDEI